MKHNLFCHTAFDQFQARGNEDPSGKLRPEIVDEVGEKYATIVLSSSGKLQQHNHAKLIQVNVTLLLSRLLDKLLEPYTIMRSLQISPI